MPSISHQAPGNPEFARVVEVAWLRGLPEFEFDLAPDAREAAALARLMGALAVRKLRFRGRLRPARDDDAFALEAELGATVTQTCVVSLEPVVTRIDAPVRRLFARGAAVPEAVDVSAPDDDEVEPLGERLDLGLVAIEALALALPDYPRRPEAELQDAAAQPEPDVKPFAALASLREKMKGES